MPTQLLPPPVTDDATRRRFLQLIGAAGLLTGCASATPDTGASPGTRTVTHARGTAEVPLVPTRVLPLDANELEQVVALGFDPVGTIPDRSPVLPDSAYDVPSAMTDAYEVDLETIATLDPDVILGPTFYVDDVYDQLRALAPTISIDRPTFANWKDDLRFVAEALGRPQRAEELLADYDRRVGEVRAAIGEDRLAGLTVSTFRPFGDDGIYIFIASFANTVLDDVGVRRPPGPDRELPPGEERIELSLEELSLLDADVIIHGKLDIGAPSSVDDSPLYQRLPAVQAGRVIEVDAGAWNQGSVLAAMRILDDLQRGFATLPRP